MDWNTLFMNMVYLVAMKSKDERAHIGAVIVGPDKEVRSTGYNSFPRGIDDGVRERQKSPEKFHWFAHAEANAIFNAARVGVPLKDCTLYTNGVPCTACVHGVINSGITEVVVDKTWDEGSDEGKWGPMAERTREMFQESGVKLTYWRGELVHIHKFRRGKNISALHDPLCFEDGTRIGE